MSSAKASSTRGLHLLARHSNPSTRHQRAPICLRNNSIAARKIAAVSPHLVQHIRIPLAVSARAVPSPYALRLERDGSAAQRKLLLCSGEFGETRVGALVS